jgi:diguanylate cyclase (GGDEF)-like protein
MWSLVADRILGAAAAPVRVADVEVSVSASVGFAMYPGDESTVDGLLKCADIAMYQAKDAGRNTHRRYSDQAR